MPKVEVNDIILALVFYSGFIVGYLICIHLSFNKLKYGLVPLFCLICIASWFNLGGAFLFAFASFISGYYYKPSIAIPINLAILAWLVMLYFSNLQTQVYFVGVAAINVLVMFGFGFMERNETIHRQKDAQTQEAMARLSTVAERERIGRDLHDLAGHALSGISLKAQVANKMLEKQRYDDVKAELKDLVQLSQSLLSEIRQAVSDMKRLSLENEIDKAVQLLKEKGFSTTVDIASEIISQLTPYEETNLALFLKEAVTNILRHSDGDQVWVQLNRENQGLRLGIKDNGKLDDFIAGNGIKGMQERAQLLGGELSIEVNNGMYLCLQLDTKNNLEVKA